MATISLTLEYPDGQGSRILDALKKTWVKNNDTLPSTPEVLSLLRAHLTKEVQRLVLQVERREAIEAAAAAVIPVDVVGS
jgi:hypothetical protein